MLLNIGTYINTKNAGRDIQKPSLTVASGRAFPIWNTIEGNNKMISFRIFGETVLNGVPSPDVPAALQSVGDTGLSLLSSNVESGAALQRIDFKDIVLRCLPDGTRDEIVYSDGKWLFIQRVGVIDCGNLQISDAKAPFFFQIEGGYPESQPYIRFTVSNFQTDSISSECNVFPNNANSEVLNSYKISAFNHLVYFSLPRSYDSQVKGYDYILRLNFMATYRLADPVERVLVLPTLSTYVDVSWFYSNSGDVRPYMWAECLVGEDIVPIQDGIVDWYEMQGDNSGADRARILNKTGTGSLSLRNFAFNRDSGYWNNFLQFDGIDDNTVQSAYSLPLLVQLYASDANRDQFNRNRWLCGGNKDGVEQGLALNHNPGWNKAISQFVDDLGVPMSDSILKDNDGMHLYTGVYNGYKSNYIGTYNGAPQYSARFRCYAYLTYSRALALDEIVHNLKYCQQRFGVNLI